MSAPFRLNIFTQEKSLYAGDIVSLIAPSEAGYLGVLAHHAPLIASTVPGKLVMTDTTGKTNTLELKSEGFLEVLKNTVTLILV